MLYQTFQIDCDNAILPRIFLHITMQGDAPHSGVFALRPVVSEVNDEAQVVDLLNPKTHVV